MAYFAVAIPKFAKADLEQIEAYRRTHDAEAQKRIPPHISLVFGIDCSEEFFVREIKQRATGAAPIDIELRFATLRLDPRSGRYLEQMVPELGIAALATLHDELYEDVFMQHQRLDLGYVPELTIGRCDRPMLGKQRVSAWNKKGFSIPGRVDALDIFMEGDDQSHHVRTVPLKGAKQTKPAQGQ